MTAVRVCYRNETHKIRHITFTMNAFHNTDRGVVDVLRAYLRACVYVYTIANDFPWWCVEPLAYDVGKNPNIQCSNASSSYAVDLKCSTFLLLFKEVSTHSYFASVFLVSYENCVFFSGFSRVLSVYCSIETVVSIVRRLHFFRLFFCVWVWIKVKFSLGKSVRCRF